MNRVFASALTLALVLSSNPAGAELLKNFHLGGQIDVQATAANNITDFATHQNLNAAFPPGCIPGLTCAPANRDRIGDAQTRVLLHMDWDILDDVHAKITLRKNDRTYGTAAGTAVPAGSQSITGSGSATSVTDNIFVDQAYFKVDKIAGQVDATFGRQFYGESGDMVIYFGPSDKAWYGLPVTAIDAGRFDWDSEWVGVTGLVGKTVGTPLGVAGPNTDVRGLNIAVKGTENIKGSLHFYNRVMHAVGAAGAPPTDTGAIGGKNDSLYIIGLKARAAGGGFWVKGEFDQDFGDNRAATFAVPSFLGGPVIPATFFAPAAHYIGWATMLNAGFKAESENVGSLTLWGEGAIGSGRSNRRENQNDGWVDIAPDYRPGSIYGRFAANAAFGGLASAVFAPGIVAVPTGSSSLANRKIWGGGFKASPAVANKLTVGASYWDFNIQRFANLPGATTQAFNGNRHLGSEIDIDATWAHSENVAFATGWGTFQPGGLVYESVKLAGAGVLGGQGVNPATLTYFDVRIKF